MIKIKQIYDKDEKSAIARKILEALPEWFEVESSREGYISGCRDWLFIAACDEETPVGFICLKETGRDTVELAVMGVIKEFHRRGIGRKMFTEASNAASERGYSFMQVKTVKMGMYEDYDRTNLFYISLGFKEFEVIPTFWDEANPCQIYVMYLK